MNLVEKCKLVEEKISRERGGFALFGLFEQVETPGRWDILVSAPWLKTDRAAIVYLVNELAPLMKPEEWLDVANVLPLDPATDFVQWITQRYAVQHGQTEINNTIIHDVDIRHGYIISANAISVLLAEYQTAA